MASRIVTFTTDFGLRDHYAGVMKGVVLGLAPGATLIDITHEVSPQSIEEGGYLLSCAWHYFPSGTVHVAVVDPGVGTSRRAIAVEREGVTFVGPDNGLLFPSLRAAGAVVADGTLTAGARGVELDDPEYHRHPVSRTFHGRDIFAQVAGHLAAGVPLSALGTSVNAIAPAATTEPVSRDGTLAGRVIHIDRFGNAVTNIAVDRLPRSAAISVAGLTIPGVESDYQAASIAAIAGSSSRLEISVRNGSAAAELGIRVGDEVVVREGA